MNNKRYFGIFHKNISDGYEIRGCGDKSFKTVIGSKDISYFRGSDKNSRAILIFEGIFDFLSYLEYGKTGEGSCDVIILNSCALWKKAVDKIEEQGNFERIELYLDNDTAGKETAENIKNGLKDVEVLDKSEIYQEYKDFSEWWENKNKSN